MPAQHQPTPLPDNRPAATLLAAAVALFLAAAAPVAAQSPPRLKPGLWEHRVQIADQSGRMAAAMREAQAALAAMPPEQRKMMEEMMARQGAGMGGGPQAVRLCLTPEEAARDEPPPAQDGCTQSARREGNTWAVSFQCPARDGEPASNGRGTVTLQSPAAYSGQFTLNTTVDGQRERVEMSTQGRWIAADCGSVRPTRR